MRDFRRDDARDGPAASPACDRISSSRLFATDLSFLTSPKLAELGSCSSQHAFNRFLGSSGLFRHLAGGHLIPIPPAQQDGVVIAKPAHQRGGLRSCSCTIKNVFERLAFRGKFLVRILLS